MTVFGDFQRDDIHVAKLLEKVAKRYPPRVKLVYAYCTGSFHKQAGPAARLAQQVFETMGPGALWRVHDRTHKQQRQLDDPETLEKIAPQEGCSIAEVNALSAK